MKAAFSKLSQCPENVEAYRSLDFDFLEYEPEQSTKEGALKIQMSNTQLTSMCKHFASIPQPRKLIFIADADDTSTNKELGSESGFKVWGNNVWEILPSIQISTFPLFHSFLTSLIKFATNN